MRLYRLNTPASPRPFHTTAAAHAPTSLVPSAPSTPVEPQHITRHYLIYRHTPASYSSFVFFFPPGSSHCMLLGGLGRGEAGVRCGVGGGWLRRLGSGGRRVAVSRNGLSSWVKAYGGEPQVVPLPAFTLTVPHMWRWCVGDVGDGYVPDEVLNHSCVSTGGLEA